MNRRIENRDRPAGKPKNDKNDWGKQTFALRLVYLVRPVYSQYGMHSNNMTDRLLTAESLNLGLWAHYVLDVFPEMHPQGSTALFNDNWNNQAREVQRTILCYQYIVVLYCSISANCCRAYMLIQSFCPVCGLITNKKLTVLHMRSRRSETGIYCIILFFTVSETRRVTNIRQLVGPRSEIYLPHMYLAPHLIEGDAFGFSSRFFAARRYPSAVYAVVCPSVRPSRITSYSKSQLTDDKPSLKWAWSRHVTHFKFLVPL